MSTMSELRRHLRETYQQAYSDLEAISFNYWEDLKWRERAVLRAIKNGEIFLTDADKKAGIDTIEKWLARWRKNQVGRGERWETLKEQMAKRLVNADKIAAQYMSKAQPEFFMGAYNKAASKIERECSGLGMGVKFTIHDESAAKWLATGERQLLPEPKVDIPKDQRWNMRLIQSQLEQAILEGDNIPALARRIQDVTGASEKAARRTANTIANRAANAGRMQNSRDAEEAGIHIGKWWMNLADERVREAHVQAGIDYPESAPIPLDEDFIVGGEPMECPNDPRASGWNVYNCRCQVMQKVMGFDNLHNTDRVKVGD